MESRIGSWVSVTAFQKRNLYQGIEGSLVLGITKSDLQGSQGIPRDENTSKSSHETKRLGFESYQGKLL